jgi:glucosylceramidase
MKRPRKRRASRIPKQPADSVTRRAFVTGAGAGAALLLASPYAKAFAAAPAGNPGNITGYLTSPRVKHAAMDAIQWKAASASSAIGDTVIVDASERFQKMLGFGAAFTDASCFVFNSMDAASRQKLYADLFSQQQMNLNVGRACIGSSDYSVSVFNYDDVPGDTSLQHFSVAHDDAYILPMLREARAINPELFLLATPWSPPGWMKTYGSMLGGWMSEKYLEPYAQYLYKFVSAYAQAGVKINALTSQNEVETDQQGRMPACIWTPEMEQDFVRDHLGPLLRKNHSDTQIWLLDHNYDLWKRVKWQLDDPQLAQYISAIAWHGYLGTPDMMTRLHDVDAKLPFYWTEGGPDITDPNYARNWSWWGETFTNVLRNWCGAIIGWNLILDDHGRPNIGPFPCGGLVTLKPDGSILQSGQYWAMGQFSRHIRRGAVRIASHSDASELSHVAFRNPDGSGVLVLTNRGEERLIKMQFGEQVAEATVPRDAIATLVWERTGVS